MSLKDLIADVNVNEICEHIETETLSEWVNAWQETAISALRPVSREQVEKVWRGKWEKHHKHRGGFRRVKGIDDMGEQHESKSTKDVSMMIYIAPNAENKAPITF